MLFVERISFCRTVSRSKVVVCTDEILSFINLLTNICTLHTPQHDQHDANIINNFVKATLLALISSNTFYCSNRINSHCKTLVTSAFTESLSFELILPGE